MDTGTENRLNPILTEVWTFFFKAVASCEVTPIRRRRTRRRRRNKRRRRRRRREIESHKQNTTK